MIRVEFTGNGFAGLEKTIGDIQDRFPLSKISNQLKADLIAVTENKGWTRGSKVVKKKVIDKNTHELSIGGNAGDVYTWLHTGTRPHIIKGNPVLAFMWNGRQNFFSHVKHPGTKPTNWFRITAPMLNKMGVTIKEFMSNPR